MIWQELINDIRQQQAFLDLFTRGWIGEYTATGGSIHCGRGCSGCCSLTVNVCFTEAVAIARELTEAQRVAVRDHVARLCEKIGGVADLKAYLQMHRREVGPCPLLTEEGSCGIYRCRPLSCRALISTQESRWCAADFGELSSSEKHEFLSRLDRSVVAFPTHYAAVLQETGRDLEAGSIRRMRERCGFSLYGSLPVLLFLVIDHRLAEACLAGGEEATRVIVESGMDHPLLVTIGQ